MYKIIIADAVEYERKNTCDILSATRTDCQIIEIDNGVKALDYIINNPVDVLITDIDLPGVSGFELISEINKRDKNIKTIIVSNNGDFEYTRKALKLGVADYMLKPVDSKDFITVFKEIIQNIDKSGNSEVVEKSDNEYVKEHILYRAVAGAEVSDNTEYDFLDDYHYLMLIDFDKDFFDGIGVDFKDKYADGEQEFTYLNLNSCQGLFLIKSFEFDCLSFAENIISKVFVGYGEKCYAAVSGVFEGRHNLSKAMEEVDNLMENKFYYKPGEVFYKEKNVASEESVNIDEDAVMKQMRQAIKMKDAGGIRTHFETFCHKYRNKTNFSQLYIKFLFANLLKDFHQCIPDSDENVLNSEIDILYKAGNFNTVIEIVNRNIDSLEISFKDNPQTVHKEIEIVKEYIYEHYNEEISVDKLADMVMMTPSYLSSIFKKETGQNLSKFIKAYRMEKAKFMLENTMDKILDISISCGYSNVSYFCSSFREYYGVSPQKFRENG